MKTILKGERGVEKCWVCGSEYDLHCHEVFYGSGYRKLSKKHGMCVMLSGKNHNLSNDGVHFNRSLDFNLKRHFQKLFEEENSHGEFMKIFDKNYLAMTFEEFNKVGD